MKMTNPIKYMIANNIYDMLACNINEYAKEDFLNKLEDLEISSSDSVEDCYKITFQFHNTSIQAKVMINFSEVENEN